MTLNNGVQVRGATLYPGPFRAPFPSIGKILVRDGALG
jgi:hypothetical protein